MENKEVFILILHNSKFSRNSTFRFPLQTTSFEKLSANIIAASFLSALLPVVRFVKGRMEHFCLQVASVGSLGNILSPLARVVSTKEECFIVPQATWCLAK